MKKHKNKTARPVKVSGKGKKAKEKEQPTIMIPYYPAPPKKNNTDRNVTYEEFTRWTAAASGANTSLRKQIKRVKRVSIACAVIVVISLVIQCLATRI